MMFCYRVDRKQYLVRRLFFSFYVGIYELKQLAIESTKFSMSVFFYIYLDIFILFVVSTLYRLVLPFKIFFILFSLGRAPDQEAAS